MTVRWREVVLAFSCSRVDDGAAEGEPSTGDVVGVIPSDGIADRNRDRKTRNSETPQGELTKCQPYILFHLCVRSFKTLWPCRIEALRDIWLRNIVACVSSLGEDEE